MTAYSDKRMVKAPLKPSPSLAYNNLCPLGQEGLAYAHTRQVVLIDRVPSSSGGDGGVAAPAADTRRVDTQDWSAVHSVASCTVGDTALLVLGNGSGLQVWDERGAILLYQWQLPPSAPPAVGAAPPSHGGFVRGIAFCVVADGSVQLCAGSSSGTIHTFSVTEGPVIRPSRRVEGHTVPLLALGSSYQSRRGCWAEDLGCELVSSDERGQLAVWAARKTGEHEVVGAIDGGVPACALAVRCGFLVAGRVDGSVRIYGLHDCQLLTEIVAHSRWLSGMDIHPGKDVLATAAEDGTLAVWALPFKGTKAASLLSVCWLNAMVTGVAFCGAGNEDVAAVAYDVDELLVWRGCSPAVL